MRFLKRFAIVVVCTACFIVGWRLGHDGNVKQPDLALTTLSSAARIEQLKIERSNLQADIADIKNIIIGTDKKRIDVKTAQGSDFASEKVSSIVSSSHEEASAAVVPASEFKTSELVSIFAGETRDQQWAPSSEKILQDNFAVEGSLQGKDIKTVECRSTTCRIDIEVHYPEEKGEIASSINKIIFTKEYGYFEPKIMITSSEKKIASYYIGRKKMQ